MSRLPFRKLTSGTLIRFHASYSQQKSVSQLPSLPVNLCASAVRVRRRHSSLPSQLCDEPGVGPATIGVPGAPDATMTVDGIPSAAPSEVWRRGRSPGTAVVCATASSTQPPRRLWPGHSAGIPRRAVLSPCAERRDRARVCGLPHCRIWRRTAGCLSRIHLAAHVVGDLIVIFSPVQDLAREGSSSHYQAWPDRCDPSVLPAKDGSSR